MKKIFLILFIISLVLILGAGIFFYLAARDLNQWLPALKNQAESALGARIEYQRAAVSWNRGLTAEFKELRIFQPDTDTDALQAKEAKAQLDLFSILKGTLQIGSIELLEPHVKLIRTSENLWAIEGLAKPKSESSSAGAAPLSFFIQTLKITDAYFIFQDQQAVPYTNLQIPHLNLEARNFSLTRPLQLKTSFSLFSETVNTKGEIRIYFPDSSGRFRLDQGRFDLLLDAVNLNEIIRSFPKISDFPLKDNPRGTLHIELDDLKYSDEKIESLEGYLKLEKGYWLWNSAIPPAEHVAFVIRVNNQTVQLERFLAKWASSTLEAQAEADEWRFKPEVSFKAQLQNLSLEQFTGSQDPEPYVSGILNAQVKGGAHLPPEFKSIWPYLFGEGTIEISEPVLHNLNLLNEIFKKISIIPGLMDRFDERLAPEYKQSLQNPHTYFETIRQPWVIQQGNLFADPFRLATPNLELTGAAQFEILPSFLSAQTMLRLDPELSHAFIRSIEELQYLCDARGLIQIPIKIQGPVSRLAVLPDLNYIASKLAVMKAQEVISHLFTKKQEQPTDPNAPGYMPPSQSADVQSSPSSGLGGLLQNALSPQPAGSPQTPQPAGNAPSGKNQLLGQLLQAALSSQGSNDNTASSPS